MNSELPKPTLTGQGIKHRRALKAIVLSLCLITLGCMPDQTGSGRLDREDWEGMKLWYSQPAKEWTEALPVGNGRLGAMIFGDPAQERLQFNEDTLWTGEPAST